MSPLSCAQKPLFMGSFGPPPLMKGTYLTVLLALPWQFKATFRGISVGYEFRIGKAKRRRYLWKRKNCQSSVSAVPMHRKLGFDVIDLIDGANDRWRCRKKPVRHPVLSASQVPVPAPRS